MATFKRHRLPVKIVLLDNQALGMVRQWQELFFEEALFRDRPVRQGLRAAVAAAFGIQALRRPAPPTSRGCAAGPFAAHGLTLLHVAIDTAANVWPLVPPNRCNAEMLDPDAARDADAATSLSKDAAHALPA